MLLFINNILIIHQNIFINKMTDGRDVPRHTSVTSAVAVSAPADAPYMCLA